MGCQEMLQATQLYRKKKAKCEMGHFARPLAQLIATGM